MLPGERVTGVRLAGVLLGLGGVAILSGLHFESGSLAPSGTLAVVAAAPLYAAAQLYIQQRREAGAVVLATAGMAAGALILLPFSIATLPASMPSSDAIGATLALGSSRRASRSSSSTGCSRCTAHRARRS